MPVVQHMRRRPGRTAAATANARPVRERVSTHREWWVTALVTRRLPAGRVLHELWPIKRESELISDTDSRICSLEEFMNQARHMAGELHTEAAAQHAAAVVQRAAAAAQHAAAAAQRAAAAAHRAVAVQRGAAAQRAAAIEAHGMAAAKEQRMLMTGHGVAEEAAQPAGPCSMAPPAPCGMLTKPAAAIACTAPQASEEAHIPAARRLAAPQGAPAVPPGVPRNTRAPVFTALTRVASLPLVPPPALVQPEEVQGTLSVDMPAGWVREPARAQDAVQAGRLVDAHASDTSCGTAGQSRHEGGGRASSGSSRDRCSGQPGSSGGRSSGQAGREWRGWRRLRRVLLPNAFGGGSSSGGVDRWRP